MSELEAVCLVKTFGSVRAVDGVSFKIDKGEFVSLLGPSGCGKTTTLRMIAGLEIPTSGKVLIGGKDVTHLPPHVRPVSMVFQNYALFPHMTVRDNVAFGLKMRKTPRSLIQSRVYDVLAMVGLEGCEARYPSELSGGQQQRVALSRALVTNPEVLLLDEPLSNLDAKLRREMRIELRDTLKQTGVTALYVTHDQEEALSLSDRIIILRKGKVLQIGSPMEIYQTPGTAFVADFMGQVNIFRGEVQHVEGDRCRIVSPDLGTVVGLTGMHNLAKGDPVMFIVRRESVRLRKISSSGGNSDSNRVPAVVQASVYLGREIEYLLQLMGSNRRLDVLLDFHGELGEAARVVVGERVVAEWPSSACLVVQKLEAENG